MLCKFVRQSRKNMDNVSNEGNKKWQSKHEVTKYKRVWPCGVFGDSVSDNKERNSRDLSESLWNIWQHDNNRETSLLSRLYTDRKVRKNDRKMWQSKHGVTKYKCV